MSKPTTTIKRVTTIRPTTTRTPPSPQPKPRYKVTKKKADGMRTTDYNAASIVTLPKNSDTHIITRCEQICAISYPANAPSMTLDYFVNPSNRELFPWLSSIANSWDNYEFVSLAIQYIPDCSVAATGNVTMAFDYDVTDPNPHLTQTALSAFAGAVQGTIYRPWTLRFKPQNQMQSHRYYTGPAFNDRLNSPAHLYVIISAQNTTTPGRLWATYTIKLINPQTNDGVGTPNTMVVRPDTGTTATHPFGTSATSTVTGTVAGAVTQEVVNATKTVINSAVQKQVGNMLFGTTGLFSAEISTCTFHNAQTRLPADMNPGLGVFLIRGTPGQHIRVEGQISGTLTIPPNVTQNAWPIIINTDSETIADFDDWSFLDIPRAIPDYYSAYGGGATDHILPPWVGGATGAAYNVDIHYMNTFVIGPRGFSLLQFELISIEPGVTIADDGHESHLTLSLVPDPDGRNDL